MERVIQNEVTGQFLASSGEWVDDWMAGAHFNSLDDARQFCLNQGITGEVKLLVLLDAAVVKVELFTE